MTDRLKGITVLFDREIREDDAQCIIDAVKMIKGVASVRQHVVDPSHWLAVSKAKHELTEKIWKVLRDDNRL